MTTSAASAGSVVVARPSRAAAASRTVSDGRPETVTSAPCSRATCAARSPIGPGPVTRTRSPGEITGGSQRQLQMHASGSISVAARSESAAGARWRFLAGTIRRGAKAPSTNEPIDRRSRAEVAAAVPAHRAGAARREVRLRDDPPTDPGRVGAVADRADDAAHLVSHRHGRRTGELGRLDVEVGAADAGAEHVEERLARARRALLALRQGDVAGPGATFVSPITRRGPRGVRARRSRRGSRARGRTARCARGSRARRGRRPSRLRRRCIRRARGAG